MHLLKRINLILILWLFIAAGTAFCPARSLASCEMGGDAAATASHACCIKKAACDCEAPSGQVASHVALPGAHAAGCTCEVAPEPVNSAPQIKPIRILILAALPIRAGPLPAPSAKVISPITSPACDAPSRFASPSPSRAPPFQG